ncbi:solute carrier family 22 member 4 isoform X2 [Episyrphus balteatus]|uniref:solute carrier family 22 member 4 isoform X2 n=1 Tax=Episyrphus balteatus TaxID=286459 RepID=UPI0024863C6E|nr:solute carrier family 22 member 4 isoform X2 [Episyrphus balteatus]
MASSYLIGEDYSSNGEDEDDLTAESPLLRNQDKTESLPTSVTNISTPLLAPIAIPESLSSSPANVRNEARIPNNNNNNNNNNNTTTSRNNNINFNNNISCRRRSSASSVTRLDTSDGTNATAIYDATSSTQSLHNTPIHKQTLYPVDSFALIEGKPPKAATKMQTKVDAVGKITGEWGKWQLRTVLLIFLCKIPSSWFMACIIFTAPAPRHGEFYCKPPDTLSPRNHTKWIKVSHPALEEVEDHEFNIDFCNVYQDALEHAHQYYHYQHQDMEPRLWDEPSTKNATVIPCKAFEHKSDYPSLITQFDLVCSRDILVAVTQFFHLFGVLTGGILATHLLKYFSPRNVMLFGMITQIICGNLTGHVSSYELHVFFRCLSAVCCCQMYTAGAMIFMDITTGTYRTVVCTLFEQFWSVGVIMLPGVASFSKSWTFLYMAISWPTVILIYLWRWIPDSPRWMIQRGRVLEAKAILQECIEMNGTKYCLPHDIDQQLQLQAITSMEAAPPSGWWSLWKGPRAVRHMICVHLCWSLYIVVYYGMLLNIRSFSREHLEINTIIAGCSEITGTFIGLLLILTTSKKWQCTGAFNIVAGMIAWSAWLIPDSIKGNPRVALLMLSAMISKAAISCTLSILTTCTTELVTEDKKKICAYSTIVWARIWLLTAPFVGATVIFGQLVPQSAFASFTIIGGVLSILISSPRTISKQKTTLTTTTTTSTQDTKYPSTNLHQSSNINNNNNNNNNQAFSKKSNLPPELIPGIWTTKNHDEHPQV